MCENAVEMRKELSRQILDERSGYSKGYKDGYLKAMEETRRVVFEAKNSQEVRYLVVTEKRMKEMQEEIKLNEGG